MHLLILSSPKFHHCPTIFPSSLLSTDLYTYRASNSHSGNCFCISHKWMSESPPFCRRLSCLRGFHSMRYLEMTKGCYTRSVSKSCFGRGLCNSSTRVSGFLSVCTDNGNLSGIKCEGGFVEERGDNFYMRRCVELARKAAGCTSPNPMVGCVIVKNGEIVGEGFHPKAGQPHAEVFALKDAGTHAENATAYVSLEPCNHHGRTPPCTEALIQAKVKQVIVGMVDPNPIVASKGVERLKEAGIEVTVGVEEELCQKLNEAYIHQMLTGKPFVTLRYSLSFNGQILSQISKGDEGSSGYYLQLLQEHDGVIIFSTSVSSNTDFSTFHLSGAKQPLLIIVTTASDPPLHLPSLTEEVAQHTVIFTDKDIIVDPVTKLNLGKWGTEIVVLDQVNLNPITDYCGRHGLCSILMDFREDCSSFHEILQRGLEEGLVQKVVMEVCPLWAGRKENPILELKKSIEKKPVKLKDLQSRVLKGGSVLVEGYLC